MVATVAEWGFVNVSGSQKYIFRSAVTAGVWGNWFAVIDDGAVESTADTGISPGLTCEDAQELQIIADGNFVTYLIDGVVKASFPTPVGFLSDAFMFRERAVYGGDEDISNVILHTDGICNSEGRSCAVPFEVPVP